MGRGAWWATIQILEVWVVQIKMYYKCTCRISDVEEQEKPIKYLINIFIVITYLNANICDIYWVK